MFFYIGENCPIKSLEQKTTKIFLDKGWQEYNIQDKQYWVKGYSTECVLFDNLEKIILGYKPAGKWAVICEDGQIYFPALRGFPIHKNEINVRTNIPLDNFVDEYYDITKIVRPDQKITLDQAADEINFVLTENIKNVLKYNAIDKLRVLFSGGIDTLTVWSIVENLGLDYDLYINTPKHNNIFRVTQEYQSDLIDICRKKFWGYKMTSCFSEKNYYLTGFYSERVQLREVSQGHAIANFRKLQLHELPKKSDYLYWFLQRPVNKINNQPHIDNEHDLIQYCNQSVFYDHQMWHIDQNFHISPFNDLRITEIINKLTLDDIITNALDATIQKKIISKNKLDFLQILSNYKNEKGVWMNYIKNFEKIVLKYPNNKFIS